MGISVMCDACDRQVVVADSQVGKKIRCPHCGQRFLASAAQGRRKQAVEREGGFEMPWGLIVKLSIVGLIVGGILAFYLGPVQVNRQWEAMAPSAESEIRDVLVRGLETHLAQVGLFDPSEARGAPLLHVLQMFRPLAMSMPQFVEFRGTTSEGEFTGQYNTRTHEVSADVEIGGLVVPGLDQASKHGKEKIRITGMNRDGKFHVEVNGKDATNVPIRPPKKILR